MTQTEKTVQEENPDSIDKEVVEASVFLSKILRHEPEAYGIQLNSRGWASVKDIRTVFKTEFKNSCDLLKSIIEQDDKNRFQIIEDQKNGFAMIRATRGHTVDNLNITEVEPEESSLEWFIAYDEKNKPRYYVEAVDEQAVKTVLRHRVGITWDSIDVEKTDKNIYWKDRNYQSDSLSGNHGPHSIIYQDGRKYLKVEKRVNQAGDKGRYITHNPIRVKSRLSSYKY